MVVAVRAEDGGFVGTFQLREAKGSSAERQVRGETCREVVDALAVVTAIALRPDERKVSPAPKGKDTARAKPAPPKPERFRGRSAWGRRAESVERGTLRYDPQFSWTLSGGAAYGPVPKVVVPELDLTFHLANFLTTPDGHQRVVGPILLARVALSIPPEATYRSSDTETQVDTMAVALGVCWSPLYDTGGLVVLGCGEVGTKGAFFLTEGTDGTRFEDDPWLLFTSGPVISLGYNLGSLVHLGLKAGFSAAVGDASAVRTDGSRVFDSVGYSAYGFLGLGLHF
ncbi:MAG: hypothetical protein JW751_24705 [Polyangiaceae bacterium]|nr:hypothetical protein [Polyangiaceae bacterium]